MAAIDFATTHFSWWAWKAANSGNSTQAVLTTPNESSVSHSVKDNAKLYHVDPPCYSLYRKAFVAGA